MKSVLKCRWTKTAYKYIFLALVVYIFIIALNVYFYLVDGMIHRSNFGAVILWGVLTIVVFILLIKTIREFSEEITRE